jgi:LysM repeat protein
VVKKGDTLGQLAKSKGTTVDKVVELNPGLNPDKIRIGQTLKFPA